MYILFLFDLRVVIKEGAACYVFVVGLEEFFF